MNFETNILTRDNSYKQDRGERELEQTSKIAKILDLDSSFEKESLALKTFAIKYYKFQGAYEEKRVAHSLKLGEFLDLKKEEMRLHNYLYNNYFLSKLSDIGEFKIDQDFIATAISKIAREIIEPKDKLEKIDGYNHFLELLVELNLKQALQEIKILNWKLNLSTGRDDFFEGVDLTLTFEDAQKRDLGFRILIDLTASLSYETIEKKWQKIASRVQKKDKSQSNQINEFGLVFSPVLQENDKQNWYSDIEEAVTNVKRTGHLKLENLKHKPQEVLKIFIDEALKALDNHFVGNITEANISYYKSKLLDLKNRLEFA